jgi:hypothetical protein
MPKFRKKPVVIEAWQFNEAELTPDWLSWSDAWSLKEGHGEIETLEGIMTARPGDWIIKGVKGEIYPCKPDIFEATYEPVPLVMPEIAPDMEECMRQAMQEPGDVKYMQSATPHFDRLMNNYPEPGPAIGDVLTLENIARGKGWLERTTIEEIDLDDAPEAYAGGMDPSERYTRFRDELESLINSRSMENGSDTPDFMLAAFMVDVLMAFDTLMRKRDGWYGSSHRRLKAQLEAEGSHTEALQADNEGLRVRLEASIRANEAMVGRIAQDGVLQAELEEERRRRRENAEEIGRLKHMLDSYITSEPDKGD